MKKLTVLATLGLIALVSVGVLLLSLGTIGTAYAAVPLICNGDTLSGTIDGNLIVPTGSGGCFLEGATVNGNITVGHSGVQLHVHAGSTVNGNIRSSSGTVHVVDATVNGNIKVKDCGGSINLERSLVNGNVQLTGNGTVLVTDNTIFGNLNLKGNGGRGSGAQTTVVTGNTISRNLTLKDNTGVTESGNIVGGKRKITP